MASIQNEKRLLQRVVAIAALVPVATGLFGVLFGHGVIGERAISVSADSHFRFLSGLLLGIGLCFWSTLPRIEEKTTFFRFLTLVIVLGGLGRLIGLFGDGRAVCGHDRRHDHGAWGHAGAVLVADAGRQPVRGGNGRRRRRARFAVTPFRRK